MGAGRVTAHVAPMAIPKIGLALGSGGLRGLAHIGVLRALDEAGLRPDVFAGSSIGAIFAAAAAHGVDLRRLHRLAVRWQGRDLFRPNLPHLLRHGVRAEALYREGPLREVCNDLFGSTTFRSLGAPLLVSTLDLEAATVVMWGEDGLCDVPVADAVYASCAMPGLLPAGRVAGRLCVDGAVLDPLGIRALKGRVDVIICVDVGSDTGPVEVGHRHSSAIDSVCRARAMMSERMTRDEVSLWRGPPLLVIRPPVGWIPTLRGSEPAIVIRSGYDAACDAIARWGRQAVLSDAWRRGNDGRPLLDPPPARGPELHHHLLQRG